MLIYNYLNIDFYIKMVLIIYKKLNKIFSTCTFKNIFHIILYIRFGGAFMLEALCSIGILGFLQFLKSAVFVVRVYFWN